MDGLHAVGSYMGRWQVAEARGDRGNCSCQAAMLLVIAACQECSADTGKKRGGPLTFGYVYGACTS